MKTLVKFTNASAVISLLVIDKSEELFTENAIYEVLEKPANIQQKWLPSTYKFMHYTEAKEKMLDLIDFWLK